ncbi:MAG TPA: DUF305 domain-containing protein [Gemmatimonadaceae bacterium]|nr:DUF305 domain-containing protein [Gemmatimonadaceae bacterium]
MHIVTARRPVMCLCVIAAAACSAATRQSGAAPSGAPLTPAQMADEHASPFTPADVAFMQGMIHHHAQAVTMAAWAPTHGASSAVQTLAGRISVAQRDEIAFMQRWLRDRHQPAPDPLAHGASDMTDMSGMSGMPGMSGDTLMPGMLTPEQMKQLDAARGAEFDRLFLTFMIQHHTGAIEMVQHLLAVPGAAQDQDAFRFVSDVNADQSVEIDRMRKMLAAYDASSHQGTRP